MTQKKPAAKRKPNTKGNEKPRKEWKKPKITRHGNMRQLTQMSA
jgi:hypothetical protein